MIESVRSLDAVAIDVSGRDPLGRLLLRFSGARVLILLVAVLTLSASVWLVAAFEGNLVNPHLRVDGLHAYGHLLSTIAAPVVLILLIVGYFNHLPVALERLIDSQVLVLKEGKASGLVESANTRFRSPMVVLLPYALGAVLAIWGVVDVGRKGAHWLVLKPGGLPTLAGLLGLATTWFSFYLFLFLLVRVAVTYRVLKDFFSPDVSIVIRPLHPDRCGGLSPLGNLSARLDLGVFVLGILGVAFAWHGISNLGINLSSPSVVCGVLLYLVFSFVLFFMPLLAIRGRMRSAKAEAIALISTRFDEINARLSAALRSAHPIDPGDMAQLESVQKLYEVATKMPVLPFDRANVSKFVLAVVTPLAPLAYALAEKALFRFLGA